MPCLCRCKEVSDTRSQTGVVQALGRGTHLETSLMPPAAAAPENMVIVVQVHTEGQIELSNKRVQLSDPETAPVHGTCSPSSYKLTFTPLEIIVSNGLLGGAKRRVTIPHPEFTVEDLKAAIEEMTGIRVEEFWLSSASGSMQEGRTLASYDIQQFSYVQVFGRLRGC